MALPHMGVKIMQAAAMAGGDNKGSTGSSKIGAIIISAVAVFLLLFAAIIYILLSPIFMLFGNSSLISFKGEFESNVITFCETEQIGIYPLPSGTSAISSDYGERDNPMHGQGTENHSGIDFLTAHKSPLVAIADGTVIKTGADKNFGKYTLIKHESEEETFYTFYAHMSSNYTIRGQEVTTYQVIGKEGGGENDPYPGRSTGHHLHFEIRSMPYAFSHKDPYPYILEPPPKEEEEEEEEENSGNGEDQEQDSSEK